MKEQKITPPSKDGGPTPKSVKKQLNHYQKREYL